MSTGVPGHRTNYSVQFFKNGFSTPETSVGKSSYGRIGVGLSYDYYLFLFYLLREIAGHRKTGLSALL